MLIFSFNRKTHFFFFFFFLSFFFLLLFFQNSFSKALKPKPQNQSSSKKELRDGSSIFSRIRSSIIHFLFKISHGHLTSPHSREIASLDSVVCLCLLFVLLFLFLLHLFFSLPDPFFPLFSYLTSCPFSHKESYVSFFIPSSRRTIGPVKLCLVNLCW